MGKKERFEKLLTLFLETYLEGDISLQESVLVYDPYTFTPGKKTFIGVNTRVVITVSSKLEVKLTEQFTKSLKGYLSLTEDEVIESKNQIFEWVRNKGNINLDDIYRKLGLNICA